MKNFIEIQTTDDGAPFNAATFLSEFRRTEENWKTNYDGSIDRIFRGQASSEWDLKPSLWRKPYKTELIMQSARSIYHQKGYLPELQFELVKENVSNKLVRIPYQTVKNDPQLLRYYRLIYGELLLLQRFRNLANELGFSVPDFPKTFPVVPATLYKPPKVQWRIGENSSTQWSAFNELACVAQHYGVPTRLLDWTYNPLTAAYFAATDWLKMSVKPDKISVWSCSKKSASLRNLKVRLISPARSNNLRIFAQDGVLMQIVKGDRTFLKNNDWPALNEENNHTSGRATKERNKREHSLVKFTLEGSQVHKLVEIL